MSKDKKIFDLEERLIDFYLHGQHKNCQAK
jgi:hypothetical protein